MLPPLQFCLLSSVPDSLQTGSLVGVAQKVAPLRQGAIPWVQATPPLQGATQSPALQTLLPVQPPR
jgi:hypothetical protein